MVAAWRGRRNARRVLRCAVPPPLKAIDEGWQAPRVRPYQGREASCGLRGRSVGKCRCVSSRAARARRLGRLRGHHAGDPLDLDRARPTTTIAGAGRIPPHRPRDRARDDAGPLSARQQARRHPRRLARSRSRSTTTTGSTTSTPSPGCGISAMRAPTRSAASPARWRSTGSAARASFDRDTWAPSL